MAKYFLSNSAKEDLIRIHQYGIQRFGVKQADKYFDTFFEYFELIAEKTESLESVHYIRPGYRRCVNGEDCIFYRVNEKRVELMAIVGRQDINELFK